MYKTGGQQQFVKNEEDSMTDSPKEINSDTADKLAHFEYDERKFFNGTAT